MVGLKERGSGSSDQDIVELNESGKQWDKGKVVTVIRM
jgi:hypothetical protein